MSWCPVSTHRCRTVVGASSSTWSRTSRRSSTSDGLAVVRLTHPFPSLLNGLIAAAVAVVAGGGTLTAIRVGLAMVALQVSIGTLNDLLDAERDVGRVPPKPIPAGLVTPRTARRIWVGSAVLGILLVLPSGPPAIAVAVLGLSIGYAYDRYAKGTAWSWLPFALGIPLVPVFGWVGAGASLPPAFVVLVPCAVLAGAALAIANASADVERDRASGAASVAVRLGLRRAWLVHLGLIGLAIVIVLTSMVASAAGAGPLAAAAFGAVVVVLGAVVGATAGERRASPRQRELAWETEAVGMGILATAWLIGVAGVAGGG